MYSVNCTLSMYSRIPRLCRLLNMKRCANRANGLKTLRNTIFVLKGDYKQLIGSINQIIQLSETLDATVITYQVHT